MTKVFAPAPRSEQTGLVEVEVTHADPGADDVVILDLAAADGRELPAWQPGAHVDVHLPSGRIRQYSLCGDPADRTTYRIAVLRVANGRGGSIEAHDVARSGTRLTLGRPRNTFPLQGADRYLFIGGGIGITPLISMVASVRRTGRPWRLLYGGRTRSAMAFLGDLQRCGADLVDVIPADERGLPDLAAALAEASDGTSVYACGPEPMLHALESACAGRPYITLHLERFAVPSTAPATSAPPDSGDTSFEVVLARTGTTLTVGAQETVLQAVRSALPSVLSSCEEGYCGTCETPVLQGEVDHRDTLMGADEQAQNRSMMICVSRSTGGRLVLDL